MKRLKKSINLLVPIFAGLILFTFCSDPKKEDNPCCKDTPAQIYTYGDTVLTFYNAFTPRYYAICDSLWYVSSKYDFLAPNSIDPTKLCTQEQAKQYIAQGITDQCPCREFPDDTPEGKDDINNSLIIDGIDQFPCNKLFIRVPGDTTRIKMYDNFNNTRDAFVGVVRRDSTPVGINGQRSPIERMLAAGQYEFELILYEEEGVGCIYNNGRYTYYPAHIIDTVKGTFCIIRPGFDNEGCVGKQEDPLLFK